MTEVKIVADSISPQGIRLTTFHLRYPRIIHAEFMTHRKFGRNARSSRAVPTSRLLVEELFVPEVWGSNKPGMQAGDELTGWRLLLAKIIWKGLARITKLGVRGLHFAGLHKAWANRPLEWFGWIDVLVTATEYQNFFYLRDDDAAQPEIQALAGAMKREMAKSMPILLRPGEWHLPYVTPVWSYRTGEATVMDVHGTMACVPPEGSHDGYRYLLPDQSDWAPIDLETAKKLSVARCARISYTPFDGNGDLGAEIERYNRLVVSRPVHASPAEHQATPDTLIDPRALVPEFANPDLHGNLFGWIQLRKTLPNEFVPG